MHYPKLIHQNDSIDYQKILFERPISRLHARQIGVVAGRNTNLRELNKIHQIVGDFKYDICIVAEPELKKFGVPAELLLTTQNKKSIAYSNTDDAIEVVNNCNYSIIGLGFDGNSKMQLMIEKMIGSALSKLLIYQECLALFRTSPDILKDRIDDILIFDSIGMKKLVKHLGIEINTISDTSVLNTCNVLTTIARLQQSHIVYTQNNQIIVVSHRDVESVGVINFDNQFAKNPRDEYVAMFVSLLSDSAQTTDDFLHRALTAGYLLKKYLHSYDNFKDALK
ncbi:MAG: hypothetical protein QG675_246 [Patescibacteria group bacterium]|nr:hypothetical protein [Patescibacteria group bacterium]